MNPLRFTALKQSKKDIHNYMQTDAKMKTIYEIFVHNKYRNTVQNHTSKQKKKPTSSKYW